MNPLRFSMKPLAVLAMLLPVAAFAQNIADGVELPGIAGTETIGGVSDLIPLRAFAGGGSNTFPLTLIRYVDSTSPQLFQAVATGEHFSSATFYEFFSFGTAPFELAYEYKAFDLVAESYRSYGRDEQVGFRFSKIISVPLAGNPGNPGNPVSAPELDASSAASGATMLAGCLLIFSARRARKEKSAHAALA